MSEKLEPASLWPRDAFNDVEIRLKGTNYTCKAHKIILYRHSSMFRDILLKYKDIEHIILQARHKYKGAVLFVNGTSIDMLLDTIYTGAISTEVGVARCLETYIYGHFWGAPILQDAAAAMFKNSIQVDMPETTELLISLTQAVEMIYKHHFRRRFTVDRDIDEHKILEHFVEHGFPLIYKYMKSDQFKPLVRQHPEFSVDYTTYLTTRIEALEKKMTPTVDDVLEQLSLYDFGHRFGASRLRLAASNGFKKLLTRLDLNEHTWPTQYNDIVDSVYGASWSRRKALAPEKDNHGIRDFFREHFLPGASKYLNRQRTEMLMKEIPEFAVDFYRSLTPDLGALAWREDNSSVKHEEDERVNKRPRLH